MTGILPEVADALKTALNLATFDPTFTATRSFAGWRVRLENLTTDVRVDVVPVDVDSEELHADGLHHGIYFTDIVVRKKFTDDDHVDGIAKNESVDPLCHLVEQIKVFFMHPDNRRSIQYPEAAFASVQTLFPYVPAHLPSRFTGVVRVGMDVSKAFT